MFVTLKCFQNYDQGVTNNVVVTDSKADKTKALQLSVKNKRFLYLLFAEKKIICNECKYRKKSIAFGNDKAIIMLLRNCSQCTMYL